ncbi:hypothetical protein HanIR_Chr05g0223831 [Helianthus annuus]|nr:hypothetical protein HanIR_Chr05g0223831 [Helianthus annuus]
MYLLRSKPPTLLLRPLRRPCRQTVPPINKSQQLQTSRRFTSKEIIHKRKIHQLGQPTNTLRYPPTQKVMGHIQLLHINHTRNTLR